MLLRNNLGLSISADTRLRSFDDAVLPAYEDERAFTSHETTLSHITEGVVKALNAELLRKKQIERLSLEPDERMVDPILGRLVRTHYLVDFDSSSSGQIELWNKSIYESIKEALDEAQDAHAFLVGLQGQVVRTKNSSSLVYGGKRYPIKNPIAHKLLRQFTDRPSAIVSLHEGSKYSDWNLPGKISGIVKEAEVYKRVAMATGWSLSGSKINLLFPDFHKKNLIDAPCRVPRELLHEFENHAGKIYFVELIACRRPLTDVGEPPQHYLVSNVRLAKKKEADKFRAMFQDYRSMFIPGTEAPDMLSAL